MTDPIADMLTRIRNGYSTRKGEVVVPYSRLKFTIAQILTSAGYIGALEKNPSEAGVVPAFTIKLIYGADRKGPIHEIRRISKPGRRVYVSHEELPKVANDAGIAVVSTPKGLMTNKEARKVKLGGEIICEVY